MKLDFINGLRALAIVGVFQVHTVEESYAHQGTLVGDFLLNTWIGVNLFFILSGLVLYLPFADGKPINLKEFYIKRWLRLMPLFFICTFLCTIFFFTPNPQWRTGESIWYLLALVINTFFGTWFFIANDVSPPWNGSLWTICVEIWMSAAFPLFVIAARRLNIAMVTVIMITVMVGFKLIFLEQHSPEPLWRISVYLHALCEMAIGMVLASAIVRQNSLYHFGSRAPTCLMTAGFVIIVLFAHSFTKIAPKAVIQHIEPLYNLWLDTGLFIFLLGVISGKGFLNRILTITPVQWLGIGCYSFYVWHMPILLIFATHFPGQPTLLKFAITLIFAALSFFLIEYPYRTLRTLIRSS